MPTLLIVDDSRMDQRLVGGLLEDRMEIGIEFASDGEDALRRLDQQPPDIVLTDMQMPKMDGLELVKAIRRDYASIPVILMTAFGSEELAADALRWGAAGYVPKKQMEKFLAPTVERMFSMLDDQTEEADVLRSLNRAEWALELDNDLALCGPVVQFFRSETRRLKLFDETERMQLGVALDEALRNAIIHGNLELTDAWADGDEDAVEDEAEARRTSQPYSSRRVRLRISVGPGESCFEVRDEGGGFDTRQLPDASNTEALAQASGRGLMLIRSFMDEVRFSDAGNEITLIKRALSDSPAES